MHAANPSSVSIRSRQAQPLAMTQADPSLCSEPSGARVMRLVSGPPDFAKPVISIWLRLMPLARRASSRPRDVTPRRGVPDGRPLREIGLHVQLPLHRARL